MTENDNGMIDSLSNTRKNVFKICIEVLNQNSDFGIDVLRLALLINFCAFIIIYGTNINMWVAIDWFCIAYQCLMIGLLFLMFISEVYSLNLYPNQTIHKICALLFFLYSIIVLPLLIMSTFLITNFNYDDVTPINALKIINLVLGLLLVKLKIFIFHNFFPGFDLLSSHFDTLTAYTLIEVSLDVIFSFLKTKNYSTNVLICYAVLEKMFVFYFILEKFQLYDSRINFKIKGFYMMRNIVILSRFFMILFDVEHNLFVTLILSAIAFRMSMSIIRRYNLKDIFNPNLSLGFYDYVRIVLVCMNLQKEEELDMCDKFFTSRFKLHKIECLNTNCLCSISEPSFKNFFFNDFLVDLMMKKMSLVSLDAKNVAAFISVLFMRDKSISPVNEILITFMKDVHNSFIDTFHIYYIENYIQKIMEKKSEGLVSIRKGLKFSENSQDIIREIYKENLLTHRVFSYKSQYDQALNHIYTCLNELKTFLLDVIHNKINARSFYDTLQKFRTLDNSLKRTYENIVLLENKFHIRHTFLYFVYHNCINNDFKIAQDLKILMIERTKQKYSQAVDFSIIKNEYLFEKSFCLVAYMNSKKIGNIKMLYGDTRAFFDMEDSDILGKNAVEILPEIIANNHNNMVIDYPYEIEKNVFHKYLKSFLCGKTKLILPVIGIIKYLPLYSVKNGILLCGYWKEPESNDQYFIFLDENNLVKYYSKNFLQLISTNHIDYDMPVQEMVENIGEYLPAIEKAKNDFIASVISNLSYCFKKYIIPNLEFQTSLKFIHRKTNKSVVFSFTSRVQLFFAVLKQGTVEVNTILILNNPIRQHEEKSEVSIIRYLSMSAKDGAQLESDKYMMDQSKSEHALLKTIMQTNRFELQNLKTAQTKALVKISRENKLSALMEATKETHRITNAKHNYINNNKEGNSGDSKTFQIGNQSSSYASVKNVDKRVMTMRRRGVEISLVLIVVLSMLVTVFQIFKNISLNIKYPYSQQQEVINYNHILTVINQILQFKLFQLHNGKKPVGEIRINLNHDINTYINQATVSLNDQFDAIKTQGFQFTYDKGIPPIFHSNINLVKNFIYQGQINERSQPFFYVDYLRADFASKEDDTAAYSSIHEKSVELYDIVQEYNIFIKNKNASDFMYKTIIHYSEWVVVALIAFVNFIVTMIKVYNIGFNLTSLNTLKNYQLSTRYSELAKVTEFIEICSDYNENYIEKINKLKIIYLSSYKIRETTQNTNERNFRWTFNSMKFLFTTAPLHLVVLLFIIFVLSFNNMLVLRENYLSNISLCDNINKTYDLHCQKISLLNSFVLSEITSGTTIPASELLKNVNPLRIIEPERYINNRKKNVDYICLKGSDNFEFLYNKNRTVNLCNEDIGNNLSSMTISRFNIYELSVLKELYVSKIYDTNFYSVWTKIITNLMISQANLYSSFKSYTEYLQSSFNLQSSTLMQLAISGLYLVLLLATYLNFLVYSKKEDTSKLVYKLCGKYFLENDAFLRLHFMKSLGIKHN